MELFRRVRGGTHGQILLRACTVHTDKYTVHARSKICPCVPPSSIIDYNTIPGHLALFSLFLKWRLYSRERILKTTKQLNLVKNIIVFLLNNFIWTNRKGQGTETILSTFFLLFVIKWFIKQL